MLRIPDWETPREEVYASLPTYSHLPQHEPARHGIVSTRLTISPEQLRAILVLHGNIHVLATLRALVPNYKSTHQRSHDFGVIQL